jgi:hypothetical protein
MAGYVRRAQDAATGAESQAVLANAAASRADVSANTARGLVAGSGGVVRVR